MNTDVFITELFQKCKYRKTYQCFAVSEKQFSKRTGNVTARPLMLAGRRQFEPAVDRPVVKTIAFR